MTVIPKRLSTMNKLRQPPGCLAARSCCASSALWQNRRFYKYFILVLTFFCYTCYHMARKPVSMVETVWHQNCSAYASEKPEWAVIANNTNWCDWSPYDDDKRYQIYYAGLANAFEFAYAISMFFSGHIADRVNLRIFLTCGMTLSGVAAVLLGLGKTLRIHALAYYIVIQVFAGCVQSSGWPSMVSFVGAWFGSQRKGFIFGIWNSHTSVGNIIGNQIAGAFLPKNSINKNWEWSFFVPGIIIFSVGILVFLFAIPRPSDVGLPDDEEEEVEEDEKTGLEVAARVEGQRPATEPIVTAKRKKKKRPNFISNYGGPTLSKSTTSSTTNLACSTSNSNNNLTHGPGSSASNSGHHINLYLLDENSTDDAKAVEAQQQPISNVTLWGALRIPGVVEFSICLFFSKFVAYTFLYWLPHFINESHSEYKATSIATLASMFDVGGIIGGITAGLLADLGGMPAFISALFLLGAIPALYILQTVLHAPTLVVGVVITVLLFNGFCVNGPFALITTCVSAELGMHPCLKGNRKAIATVTAIIDGTGSLGAAFGPTMAGVMSRACGLSCTFYMLIGAQLIGVAFLLRLVFFEFQSFIRARRDARRERQLSNASSVDSSSR